jgi:hypothetical protein
MSKIDALEFALGHKFSFRFLINPKPVPVRATPQLPTVSPGEKSLFIPFFVVDCFY